MSTTMHVSTEKLREALAAASHAALLAGTLIRTELHRPGGPRGHGGHAEVDREAELLIRARLRERFPEWGYVGEETGTERESAEVRWFVDPNDGTSSFLRGHRGSAVSIALVAGDVPVLGVVYALCAPDDRGDLITWTEGQPLRRNGEEVARTALPGRVDRDLVVALSQDADRATAANLAVIAPARFRALPSIAYRLALVAVGEADAAVSLNHPTGWDFAGGHALLRAVGGELVDDRAAPIRYRGAGPTTNVFGSSEAVAADLARRDWPRVFSERKDTTPIARLPRDAHVADAALLARAQGCLLGQLAGDALGSLVEFQDAASIRGRYPHGVRDLADGGTWDTLAGQPTDDSEMALTLARSVVARRGFDATEVRAAYQQWLASRPFDIGNTTRAGLSARPRPESAANGSLMRCSPLGIFGHALEPAALAPLARADSEITHPNRQSTDAVVAFTAAIAFAVRTGAGPEATYEHARRLALELGLDARVEDAIARARTREPDDYVTNQGYVLTALQAAFYQLLHAPSLEQGLVDIVGRGGDTDTNAAIGGALLGAVHGRDAIPLRWRRRILSCRPLEGTANVRQPRPPTYWPVDALELAEILVLAGEGVSSNPVSRSAR